MRKSDMRIEMDRLRASLEEVREDNRRLRSEEMIAMRQAKIEQSVSEKALEAYYRMQDMRYRVWSANSSRPLQDIQEAFDWIWNGDPDPLNNFQDPS